MLCSLYQLVNPRLHVFHINFFIWQVQPSLAQPEDTVQFWVPMEMTRMDLRNYLQRIYHMPLATIQLVHGQTFTFTDLFPEKKSPECSSKDDDIQD
ncbi:39S ribosomal protein L23; mitochondrial [Camelus dromedarius]|uniref:Large ribosomal subunit protein uL23m n=1 Tax=Camelus dromedarius TaxID=9838 RepID=A0A5N4BZC2_CAMDR|nr:39S ribosomal protein L23; mitochondrial [Camelus dromedarius]